MNTSLYDDEVYSALLERLNNIKPDASPQWGKMDPAQMMAHCTEILQVYNGKKRLKTSFFTRIFSRYIKNIVFGPQPYKQNSPTAPQFKIKEPKEFDVEKKNLLAEMKFFHEMDKEKAKNMVHPLFWKISLDEKGWAMYKHLDHHLIQFEVE